MQQIKCILPALHTHTHHTTRTDTRTHTHKHTTCTCTHTAWINEFLIDKMVISDTNNVMHVLSTRSLLLNIKHYTTTTSDIFARNKIYQVACYCSKKKRHFCLAGRKRVCVCVLRGGGGDRGVKDVQRGRGPGEFLAEDETYAKLCSYLFQT